MKGDCPSFLELLLVLLLAAVAVSGLEAAGREAMHPNVLLLVVDDLRVQLGCNTGGHQPPFAVSPQMVTPHMDALAATSFLFHKAYAQQAICNPSRSSFLTSRRPDTTGVWSLTQYFRETGGNFTTLPQFFKERGYRTLGIGKIFHPTWEASHNNDPISWSEPYYFPPNSNYWTRPTQQRSNLAVKYHERLQHALPDEQVTEHAIRTLQQLREAKDNGSLDGPFFLGVGFQKPHIPFIYPQRFQHLYPESSVGMPDNYYAPVDMPSVAWNNASALFEEFTDMVELNVSMDYNTSNSLPESKVRELRRAYYACVSYIDSLVGTVLAKLTAVGLADTTIISLVSDHGYQLGEHGAWEKHTNFEVALRVPFMVRVPGLTGAGLSSQCPVELVDLFPTLVQAAGFPALPTCPPHSAAVVLCTEGRSLVPLLHSPSAPCNTAAAFSQYYPHRNHTGYSVRTGRYRYTEWVLPGRSLDTPTAAELYDHHIDPEENYNRINDVSYQRVTRKLSKLLHKGWRSLL